MVCGKIRIEATTTKEKENKQKKQEEENKTKRRVTEANQAWRDWKFQIQWNKIECGNPRRRDERKIHFVCLQLKNILNPE